MTFIATIFITTGLSTVKAIMSEYIDTNSISNMEYFYNIGLICMAGFMRKLSSTFTKKYTVSKPNYCGYQNYNSKHCQREGQFYYGTSERLALLAGDDRRTS